VTLPFGLPSFPDGKSFLLGEEIRCTAIVLICGPSKSGKSRLMIDLLDDITLWNPEPPQEIYWYYGILTDQIKELMISHPKIIFQRGFPEEEFATDPKSIFNSEKLTIAIFDDLSNTTQNSEAFCDLLSHGGRHTKTAIFSLEHYLFSNSNRRRKQASQYHCIILMRNPRTHQQIKLLANQMGISPSLLDYAYKDICVQPFGHLLIDGRIEIHDRLRLLTNITKQDDNPIYVYCKHG